MDLVIEFVQLACIVGIGVAFFNTSSLHDRSKKYENTHVDITDTITRLDKTLTAIQGRLAATKDRLETLENRVSILDPNGDTDQ
jgi:hypothetical protein